MLPLQLARALTDGSTLEQEVDTQEEVTTDMAIIKQKMGELTR